MKVYIVIDLEAPKKDCVYSIHFEEKYAEESQKELDLQAVFPKSTTIIEDYISDDEINNFLIREFKNRF